MCRHDVEKAGRSRRAIAGPGRAASDVDAAARAVIAEAGFGDYFTHGLGTASACRSTRPRILRPNSETSCEAGMVVTVEPGVYLPGWGGVRIEDDVLVTPDGCEVLTSVPKELRRIA